MARAGKVAPNMSRTYGLALRIGYRGAFLLFISISYLFHGLTLLTAKHSVMIPVGGFSAWGWSFIAVSLFMFTGVLARVDRFQYTAGVFILMLWSIDYFWRSTHIPYAWSIGLMWLFMAVAIAVCSTRPEPFEVDVRRKVRGPRIKTQKLGRTGRQIPK